MLNNGKKAILDEVKIDITRKFNYERSDGDGIDDADITLEMDGIEVSLHGTVTTLDELEYAVARVIAAARKEVGHGRTEKPTA